MCGIVFGLMFGYIIFVKFRLMNKIETWKKRKVLKDPHKLKELLEKNFEGEDGKFIDEGKEISYKIEKNDKGKEVLVEVVSEYKNPLQKKLKIDKEIKKKITKKTTKKTKKTKKPLKNKGK